MTQGHPRRWTAESQAVQAPAVAASGEALAPNPPLNSRRVRAKRYGERVVVSKGSQSDTDAAQRRFAELVLPQVDVLGRVALSLTRSEPDAEDLVQDTLLRAYRSIDGFDGRYPRAWLLTIMRNAQINRVRRKRPELLRDPDEATRTLADAEVGESTTEDGVMRNELDPRITEAFDRLPEKFRTVVELVDIDELSYAEAAEALDVPVGTIMSRLHRGRKRIRVRLEENSGSTGPEAMR